MEPVLPDYDGACLTNVVPALLGRDGGGPDWLPPGAADAGQLVLLAVDGLGWEQLQARRGLAPTLTAMAGGPIITAVPSTTATCLTSLTTGSPPGRHGVVGYRVHVGAGQVMNVLRWRTAAGDARDLVSPEGLAPLLPFQGRAPAVVTRAEFAGGGFSQAHLRGTRLIGWRMPSTLVTNVRQLLRAGEPFVYAYYDGVDKVAHEYGMGEHYDAELVATDALVAQLIDALPPGATLVVTSDHGQVDVGTNVVPLHADVMDHVDLLSGEGRFRWLHARPGMAAALLVAVGEHHGGSGWVATREEAVAAGWFGPELAPGVADRLGDVLIAAHEPVAFLDPADTGEVTLVSRHGSLTPAEMLVPLLAASV